jgi:hypothetical protein
VPGSAQLRVAPKNPFNARTVTEFKKTAAAIRKDPWSLLQGALYLENLVDPDRLGGPPPNVGALFTGFTHSGSAVQLPLPDLADVFAPGPPRPVTAFPRLACSLPFLLPLVFASMCCAPSCAA